MTRDHSHNQLFWLHCPIQHSTNPKHQPRMPQHLHLDCHWKITKDMSKLQHTKGLHQKIEKTTMPSTLTFCNPKAGPRLNLTSKNKCIHSREHTFTLFIHHSKMTCHHFLIQMILLKRQKRTSCCLKFSFVSCTTISLLLFHLVPKMGTLCCLIGS